MKKLLIWFAIGFIGFVIFSDFNLYVNGVEPSPEAYFAAHIVGRILAVYLWWVCLPRFIFRKIKGLFTASVGETQQPDSESEKPVLPFVRSLVGFLSPYYLDHELGAEPEKLPAQRVNSHHPALLPEARP